LQSPFICACRTLEFTHRLQKQETTHNASAMADSDSDWEDGDGAAADGNNRSGEDNGSNEGDENDDDDSDGDDDDSDGDADSDGDDDSQPDRHDDDDDHSSDGSPGTPKSAKEFAAVSTTKIRTRPIKHKTTAAALPNPSNYLKRSHQVLILGDDDYDDVAAEGSTPDNVKQAGEETGVLLGTLEEAKAKKPARKKKLRRVDFETEDDNLDYVPSLERMTIMGGYAHTKNTRMKISQANKGNTPWNKGKSRTESSKLKISAGVRARHQTILLEKLKKLGMTEAEWFAKKFQIKHMREKLRKARLAVKQHEQEVEAARQRRDEVNFRQAMIRAIQKEEVSSSTVPAWQSTAEQLPTNMEWTNALVVDKSLLEQPPNGGETDLQRTETAMAIQPPNDTCISPKTEEYTNDKPINDTTTLAVTAKLPSNETPADNVYPLNDRPTAGEESKASSITEVVTVGRFKDIAKAQTNTYVFPDSIPLAPTVMLMDPESPVTIMVGNTKKTIYNTNTFLDDDEKSPEDKAAAEANRNSISLCTREIVWAPHDLGLPGASYNDQCPIGGPGGLICCTSCTSRYSRYLSRTFRDLERHQITYLGEEVEEIMDYARETKKQLAESTKVAKRKHATHLPI
jgi:NUMOD3 motif